MQDVQANVTTKKNKQKMPYTKPGLCAMSGSQRHETYGDPNCGPGSGANLGCGSGQSPVGVCFNFGTGV